MPTDTLFMEVDKTTNKEKFIDNEAIYHDRIDGKLSKNGEAFRVIDLFAGAGGLTAGFSKLLGHNFKPVWANDFNAYAAKTYNKNFGEHCEIGDIELILKNRKSEIPKADIVIGGPPCQGFSLLNKNRDGDSRRELWQPFLEVVKLSGAQIFVMENVPQLLGSSEHEKIVKSATAMGFKVTYGKLCAADYGVSQVRWRAFIVGCKFRDPADFFPPKKTHYNVDKWNSPNEYIENPTRWQTVKDAIKKLPDPIGTEIKHEDSHLDLHFGRTPTPLSLKRYKAIPKEGMNRFDLQKSAPHLTPACWIRKKSGGTDLFGRLWWNRPAVTIRTEFFKPEKGRYLHPQQNRPITHREAARLQSFPDAFKFEGTKIEIAKQIGNAVPPLLAARIADVVYALLLSRKER